MAKERREKETAAAASMDQNQESTNTPSSVFKHKQTKCRSLKKANKALPNSPYKQNKIVKSLAKKYDIRIWLQEPTLKGRKPTPLTEKGEQWIVNIYLVLCETLQKKYEVSIRLLQVSIYPWKGFFPFFFSFFFSYKRNNW